MDPSLSGGVSGDRKCAALAEHLCTVERILPVIADAMAFKREEMSPGPYTMHKF